MHVSLSALIQCVAMVNTVGNILNMISVCSEYFLGQISMMVISLPYPPPHAARGGGGGGNLSFV